MNCPHCGALLEQNSETCTLCGTRIDRKAAYDSLVKRGSEAFELAEYDKAGAYFTKAYETGLYDADLCVRLGIVLDKKNDRQAAGMFLKALSFDFYNERVHSLLIGFYDKYHRLGDLKAWYEKSRASADGAFIDKQIAIIGNLAKFREQAPVREVPRNIAAETAAGMIVNGFKQYMMMNVVLGAVILIIGIAVAVGFIMKVNVIVMVAFAMFVLMGGIIFIAYARIKKMKKAKSEQGQLSDIFREFKQP